MLCNLLFNLGTIGVEMKSLGDCVGRPETTRSSGWINRDGHAMEGGESFGRKNLACGIDQGEAAVVLDCSCREENGLTGGESRRRFKRIDRDAGESSHVDSLKFVLREVFARKIARLDRMRRRFRKGVWSA